MEKEKEVDRWKKKWKTIIILSGNSTGKTIFDYVIKNNRYYVWNINPYNFIGRSEIHFWGNTIGAMMGDEFKVWYAKKIIAKFIQSDEPNVLVLHKYNIETSRKIIDEHPNVFTIDIRTIGSEVSIEHDITLFIDKFDSGDFKKEVLKTIDILTKNLGDK